MGFRRDKHKNLVLWQEHQLCEHRMRSKAGTMERITALGSRAKHVQGWEAREATPWGWCRLEGVRRIFFLCPALVKTQQNCCSHSGPPFKEHMHQVTRAQREVTKVRSTENVTCTERVNKLVAWKGED